MSVSIIVAEENEQVAHTIVLMLEAKGYLVTACRDPMKTLDTLQTASFDVMVTSFMVDQASGLVLANEAKRLQPDLRIVLASDGGERLPRLPFINSYLSKPFSIDDLERVIQAVLPEGVKKRM